MAKKEKAYETFFESKEGVKICGKWIKETNEHITKKHKDWKKYD